MRCLDFERGFEGWRDFIFAMVFCFLACILLCNGSLLFGSALIEVKKEAVCKTLVLLPADIENAVAFWIES